ncbi:MAG: hypothetical protein J7K08_01485 [Thermoplasmata archaeon]|nr:hypothetical protein [Thermoplasmata archaeon]HDD60475.1 hypothetical protein [Euryarchaeota archaeon]RLF56432.1 MAG: hypothetical protein DRN28_00460 [Thermoplasmata archaeon]RLF72045.1 MAG: hypothetical protein DRN35_01255 [Thermoplasmata archaeon]RLF72432.1 MAG: hypothetical protein DRN40_00305 [Thermoplasmata archaeon]
MPPMKVENILVETRLTGELDFQLAGSRLDMARYQPEVFRGLIYETHLPRGLVFIYETGVVKVFGVKSLKGAQQILAILKEKLAGAGFDVSFDEDMKILNVIASVRLRGEVSPKKILQILDKDSIDYNPKAFPGIVYTVSPKVKVLIFTEGLLVCYGTESFADASAILDSLSEALEGAT